MNKIKAQVSKVLGDVRTYWNIPPKGRDMGYKEHAALALGSFGAKFIITCITAMILGIGNTLIGNAIGISPINIGIIYALSVLLSLPLGALRANMIDRSRLKKGKYRPFILYMGIPTVILGTLFVWMPYDAMSMFMKCATVLVINVGFQFFYMFFFDIYENLPNVLSSNTIERSDTYAIRNVVANFAPTVINAILPFVALWVTGESGNLDDITIYRVFYPVLLIIGFLLSMVMYTHTSEKVVEARTHAVKVKLSDSFRALAKNKYFWIMVIAASAALLETAYVNLLWWMYNYQGATSAGGYSIITLIYGNASLWPMLLAPIAIRLFGKRNLLIYSNLLNVVFIMILLPIMMYGDMDFVIWVVLACMFVNSVATMMGGTIQPSMQGDVRDYQHYITGERMDGIFVYLTLLANFAAMLFAFVLLYLQEAAGLNVETAISLGFSGDNVYDVLYNEEYFRRITSILIMVSGVGAVMNVVPYFFYDLTEDKQRSIVSVLRIRAFFEDYGNDSYADEKLIEAVGIVNEALEYKDQEKVKVSKASIKQAKSVRKKARFSYIKHSKEIAYKNAYTEAKATVKEARAAHKAEVKLNQTIGIAQFVYNEINKYNTLQGNNSYLRAVETVSQGLSGYIDTAFITVEDAKAMPKENQADKDARKLAVSQAKNFISSKKLVEKHYNGRIEEFDETKFDAVLDPLNQCEKDLLELYKAEIALKENKIKDISQKEALKKNIAYEKAKRAALQKDLRALTNEHSIYVRAVRPYIEAVNLIKQRKNYSNLAEVQERYVELMAETTAM